MNSINISIATITWARDENEENILKESLTELAKLGLPTFITDGGSSEGFIKFLESFMNFTILPSVKGLWNQTRNSLKGAYSNGSEHILYTEPDKTMFFTQFLPTILKKIELSPTTGIYIMARNANGFSTFPKFQQITETTINKCCYEVIKIETDFVYGPFLINREIIPHLYTFPEHMGWGWRPYAMNLANRMGYKIKVYEDHFNCPDNQMNDTAMERIYRMKQMNQNIEGLISSTTIDLNS